MWITGQTVYRASLSAQTFRSCDILIVVTDIYQLMWNSSTLHYVAVYHVILWTELLLILFVGSHLPILCAGNLCYISFKNL